MSKFLFYIFGGFVLFIMVCGWSTYFVILFEDSSSTLWIRPLFCLLWFYPLFQGRFVCPAYRRFVSIVLLWIRPLLLIKLGFMTAYSVTLCEDSSSNLWIRPLILFVVVLSTVSGQIRLPCLQEIRLHCFSVDSSTVAYKAWLYGSLFCYFV